MPVVAALPDSAEARAYAAIAQRLLDVLPPYEDPLAPRAGA